MKTGTLVLAQACDAATLCLFYWLGLAGQMQERNPVVVALMAFGGVQLVALVKVGVALLASRRAARNRRNWRVSLAVGAATLSGVVGAGFNLAAILSSVRA